MTGSPNTTNAVTELNMLVPTTHAAALRIIHTSAVECNNADYTPHQSLSFYLSVLTAVFPGLLPLAKETLQKSGHIVTEITEHTAAENLITLQRWTDVNTSLAIFGQFALIMYKNISDQSYDAFIQSYVAEIKIEAGVVGELVPGEGDMMLSITTVKNIRTIVGSSSRIRVGLLKVILANRDGGSRLNRVCKYVAESISWTGMTQLMFVFETFCVTGSPVLKEMVVRNEVMNLCEAYERIMEKQYPQYYGILHPSEAGVTIVRSRFANLAEAAKEFSFRKMVDDLASMHHAHMDHMATEEGKD